MTAFKRSSNSPRYLVPATRAAKSKVTIRLSNKKFRDVALFNTLGKPFGDGGFAYARLPDRRTGLFLVRRERIWITRSISSSRPITGSKLLRPWPFWVRSRPKVSKAGVLDFFDLFGELREGPAQQINDHVARLFISHAQIFQGARGHAPLAFFESALKANAFLECRYNYALIFGTPPPPIPKPF